MLDPEPSCLESTVRTYLLHFRKQDLFLLYYIQPFALDGGSEFSHRISLILSRPTSRTFVKCAVLTPYGEHHITTFITYLHPQHQSEIDVLITNFSYHEKNRPRVIPKKLGIIPKSALKNSCNYIDTTNIRKGELRNTALETLIHIAQKVCC